jgi:hypothetical protein
MIPFSNESISCPYNLKTPYESDNKIVVVPTISIVGSAVITIIKNESYTEQGATANGLTVTTTGTVDTSTLGTYSITYSATDSGGQTTTSSRTIFVVDNPPVITMSNGDATEVYHERYTAFTDLTATAVDDVDGTLTVTPSGDTVNINTLGTYVRTYSATDSAGQTTTVTRNIIVRDTIDPTATVNISSSILDVTISLTSISENNCSIQVYSDSGYSTLITSTTITTETTKDITFTESISGTYTYYIRITDGSNNSSDYSASVTVSASSATVYTITVLLGAIPNNGNTSTKSAASEADLIVSTADGTQIDLASKTVFNNDTSRGDEEALDDDVLQPTTNDGQVRWVHNNSTCDVGDQMLRLVTGALSAQPEVLSVRWRSSKQTPGIKISLRAGSGSSTVINGGNVYTQGMGTVSGDFAVAATTYDLTL